MTTTTNRKPHMVDITTTAVVILNIKDSSYSSGLKTDLGYTALPESGEVPTGKTLVGKGKITALQRGCFGIWLKYAKTATKFQIARVICSPTKADTVFTDAKGETYAGKPIVEVLIPRRRQIVF